MNMHHFSTFSSAPQLTPSKLKLPPKQESPVSPGGPILDPVLEVQSPEIPTTPEEDQSPFSPEMTAHSDTVAKRPMSEETKRVRRIKTKSKVETVL